MTRADIAGGQFTLFGYTVELVTIRHAPCVLAIWRGAKLIKRFERGQK